MGSIICLQEFPMPSMFRGSAVVLLALGLVCTISALKIDKDALAQKAIDEALKLGMGVLDSVMSSFYEDAAKVCYWNDWQARDGRASIEKTFTHGRFSQQKKTAGIPNGRWYCCYKQDALVTLGHDLDY